MTTAELIKILQDADPSGALELRLSPDLYYAYCSIDKIETKREGDTLRLYLELNE